jgi:amino acid adenylation domain-containing protein
MSVSSDHAMLSIDGLLQELKDRGVELLVDGDALRCRAPKGALTADLQAAIRQLKPQIIAALHGADSVGPSGPRHEGPQSFPLSFAQERLWFINQLEPENTSYNITAYWKMPRVDPGVLRDSLGDLVARHDSLRTAFVSRDGDPMQVVLPSIPVVIRMHDLRDAPAGTEQHRFYDLARAGAAERFDLTAAPLFRTSLVSLPDEDVILVTIHHIVADGWSLGILCTEWTEIYQARQGGRAARLRELRVSYGEFAAADRERLTDAALASDTAYWTSKLANAPAVLELPVDRPRPAVRSHAGSVMPFTLPASVVAGLKGLAREERASQFMMLLTVFKALLTRYTGSTDIVVGSPISGRTSPELEPVIGMFVNTVVLRTGLADETSARALLNRVKDTVLEAHAHLDMPFTKLIEVMRPDRSLSHSSPLFQVAFVLQNTPSIDRYQGITTAAMFDLTLLSMENADGLYCAFEYSTELFDDTTIARMAKHFEMLASAIVANPDLPIAVLPMMPPAEIRQIEEWNRTATDYPREATIHQLFEEQVARTPDAIAVISAAADGTSQAVTYAELDRRATQTARALRAKGVTRGSRVGICVERSVEAFVAIIAVLKAGGAYVPLDPTYPDARLSFMLRDADLALLVAESSRPALKFTGPLHRVDSWAPNEDGAALSPNWVTADDLAYLMYTSGSTGTPKAVCVPHRAVVRLVRGANYATFGANEVLLAAAPMSFDASTLEIWGALLNGGKVVLPPPGPLSLSQIARSIRADRITTLWLTAGLFHQMVENHLDDLALVPQLLAGGDVLSVSHVNRLLAAPGVRVVINGYGPTENTTFTTCYRAQSGEQLSRTVPIGRPISNTSVHVLDKHMRRVPIGVAGELYAGGDGLATGYWRRDDLTNEKFVPNPFGGSARLYRTGDMVRYRPDGNIEFIGRVDTQVKLRGFRIELDEISAVVRAHPGVRDAVVTIYDSPSAGKTLACYLVASRAGDDVTVAVREHVARELPDYMVPTSFTLLETLPLTVNGKVDRNALPAPSMSRAASEERCPPRSALETQLASIWEHVLGVQDVSIRDNFFDLGGHSLLAMKLFSRLEKVFGTLPVSMLFQAPTIEQMAQRLAQDGHQQPWSSLVLMKPTGTRPPLFLVPGVTGNVLTCTKLASALSADQPVYGLQSVGLDGRERPLDSIGDIAGHFLKEIMRVQPEGKYHLAGLCMGGAVAYEIAQRLRRDGREVATLVMVDTWTGNVVGADMFNAHDLLRPVGFVWGRVREGLREIRSLSLRQQIKEIWRKTTVAARLLDRSTTDKAEIRTEYQQHLVEEANRCAMVNYKPEPYDGHVTYVAAEGRMPLGGNDPRLEWTRLATAHTIHRMAGTSTGRLLKEPLVGTLANYLNESLQDAKNSAPASLLLSVLVASGFA